MGRFLITVSTDDITMSDIMMVFAILLGIMLVSLIVILSVRSRQKKADSVCPVLRAEATVVDKQQLPAGTVTFASLSRIWILFDLADGRRLKLFDTAANDLVVGDTGELVWQGSSIVRFQRKVKSQMQ